jgi:hypothetical protein
LEVGERVMGKGKGEYKFTRLHYNTDFCYATALLVLFLEMNDLSIF